MSDKDKEQKQGPLSRVLSKHAGRAKERLLQNLGKADRTTDVDFDLCVKNFTKQQNAVSRLHKEFKNYHLCLKAMQASRKSLMDTVCELYEPCWDGGDQFLVKAEILHQNFDEFCEKINNMLLAPVTSYMAQFPELNNKISKRNRKLLDYDNCRHNLQNLETLKKREEAKISKAKEQLDEARNLFEVINTELHEELPALYESRVSFFISHLQCLFLAEAQFHGQDSTILLELNGILESLDDACKKELIDRPKPTLPSIASIEDQEEEPETEEREIKSEESVVRSDDGSSSESASGSATFSTPPTSSARNCHLNDSPVVPDVFKPAANEPEFPEFTAAGDIKPEEKVLYKVDEPLPYVKPLYNVLYKVKGTYKYVAEDSDELSFDVGDIIDVIAFDDPDEQEEGWLKGVANGRVGLFPANFTSRM